MIKLLILAVSVAGMLSLIGFLTPRFSAGIVVGNKQQSLLENLGNYNTVFVGTSRINHGLDPIVFDETIRKEFDQDIRSFNFGIAGASLGEVSYIVDYLLENGPEEMQYILVELCSVEASLSDKFCVENLKSSRNKYWLDQKRLELSLGNLSSQQSAQKRRLDNRTLKKNYYTNYLENIFQVGMLEDYLSFAFRNKKRGLGRNQNGFNSLDNNQFATALDGRRAFLNNGLEIEVKKARASKTHFGKPKDGIAFNKHYHKHLQSLEKQAAAKNIRLIYIVPPLLPISSYEELAVLHYNLPTRMKINVANSQKYPEFYSREYVWDGNHLNEEGATLLSKEIARIFGQKVFKAK